MANNVNNIDFKLINDKQLYDLFNSLETKLQNRIVLSGMRKAANVIIKEVKSYFQKVKKNKSKTNYANFNKLFKIESIKNPDNGFGLKLGITKDGYKYRWINWGTEERSYIKGLKRSNQRYRKSKGSNLGGKEHKTGKLSKTNFFYDAVEAKQQTANNMISDAVVQSLKRTVDRYNKK
jgi:hypothetical protein